MGEVEASGRVGAIWIHGGGWVSGIRDGFKNQGRVLLIPVKELTMANPPSLLPHPQRVFLEILNRKPIHGAAVQYPLYNTLQLDPPWSISGMGSTVLAL